MKITNVLLATVLSASLGFVSCKPKDADIKVAVEEKVKTTPGVTVEVKDGVATLTGEVKDDAAKAQAEAAAKTAKDVKSVVNNLTVPPPPPPAPPVVITADDPLAKAVTDATKDFPTAKATVTNGIIAVTGELSADKWKKLKIALDGLHPKKVDASGLTIK